MKERAVRDLNTIKGQSISGAEIEMSFSKEFIKAEKEILQELKAEGGPTNALDWFCEGRPLEEDALYKRVQYFHNLILDKMTGLGIDHKTF